MTVPVILSLSPAPVVAPVHQQLRDQLREHEFRVLEQRTASGLYAAIGSADLILGDWTAEVGLTATALAAAGRCRLVVQPTAGFDSIDIGHARELAIPVANTPGANARGVAEWTVMAMLATLKNVVVNHERTGRGEWWMVEAAEEGLHDLGGRTVGILGFGRIGQGVARRLHAFEVREILYHDAYVGAPDTDLPVAAVDDVDELCRRCDVLSVHVPLTPRTRHLIDRRRLALLGPDAVLVNTSRGAVVDEEALLAALQRRELKAAALDVFSDEPLSAPHRWQNVANVLLSPHLAGSTIESRERMVSGALRTLDRAIGGELPGTVVNGVAALR